MNSSVSRIAGHGGSLLLRNVNLVAAPTPSDAVDVLVQDGIVVSVGRASAGTEAFDLDGRFVLRGLWDHHVHFDQLALMRQRVDLSGTDSAAAVVALVAESLSTAPSDDAPLAGFGLRDGLWDDPPTLDLLDAVSPVRPVVLASQDLHSAWLNTAAFHRFGLPERSDGIVREQDFDAVLSALNEVPAATLDAWVHDAAREAATRGLVGVIELEHGSLNVDVWSRRVVAGTRSLRIECGVYAPELDKVIGRGLRTGDVLDGTHGLVAMGPLKVITDGSLNTRTAYCYGPYPGLEGSPDGHGLLVVPPEELVPLMARANAAGLHCAIHAIGDRANALALDAFESTGSRGSIEHAQLLDRADLGRFAELGVVASIQPEHAVDDRDVADRHWTGRTDRAFAYADLLAAGATLRMGSDAPVAPLDPWITIAAAVRRSGDDRPSWHAEQEISVEAALDASTRGRAYIREGDRADLVVTDLDPLRAAPKEIRTMPVHGTLLAGRWTWRAD